MSVNPGPGAEAREEGRPSRSCHSSPGNISAMLDSSGCEEGVKKLVKKEKKKKTYIKRKRKKASVIEMGT